MDQETPPTDNSTLSTPQTSLRFAQHPAPITPCQVSSGSLAGDILYGADAIAEFMFGTREARRSVYYLIGKESIPHFRIGATLCARKSVLL
jgi:hypothetical protein